MTDLEQDPVYRAGFNAGAASRQGEVDRAEHDAARFYRAAFNDEWRRPGSGGFADAMTVKQRRAERLAAPRPDVSVAEALASWGLEAPPTITDSTDLSDPSEPAPASTAFPRSNRMSRRRAMSTRTITGHLADDPAVEQAGSIQITKLRVIENTGEYRKGEWFEHPNPTTHYVDAKFDLGANAAASLHKGDHVIVVGYEHTVSWGAEGEKRYGRVIEADAIGAALNRATAVITKTPRPPRE